MGQRYDITAYKDDTYVLTIDYTDSLGSPIALDSTTNKTWFTVRPQNDNTSTPTVSVNVSTTSAPTGGTLNTSTFYFPAGYTNRTILYLAQYDFDTDNGSALFRTLNVNQAYYYDIVVTRSGSFKSRVLSGYFTINTGITNP